MVMQKFQPSKLQAAVMVFQLQFIDTFVQVPEITKRQVPVIQKVQKDQKTLDAQISSEVYVDRTKDSQDDIRERQECSACRKSSTASTPWVRPKNMLATTTKPPTSPAPRLRWTKPKRSLTEFGSSADTGSSERR